MSKFEENWVNFYITHWIVKLQSYPYKVNQAYKNLVDEEPTAWMSYLDTHFYKNQFSLKFGKLSYLVGMQ